MENNNYDVKNTQKIDIMYIHLLRIFAMCCVIILHCITVYFADANNFGSKLWVVYDIVNEIARKGVPLFFMISGYLALKSKGTLNFKEFYKKRLSKLILPFLVWDVLYYCFYRIDAGQTIFSTDFFAHLLWCGSACHLWFIYAIMMIYLVLPFFKMIVDKCSTLQIFWLFILSVFTTTIRPFINLVSPVYFQLIEEGALGGYIGWFILGYLLGNTDMKPGVRAIIYIGGIAGFCLGVFGNYYICSVKEFDLVFNKDNQINHYLVSAAIFVLFKNIRWSENKVFCMAVKYFSSLSFGIYFAHIMVLELFLKLPISLVPPVYNTVKFVFVLVVSTLFTAVVSKTKYLKRLFM